MSFEWLARTVISAPHMCLVLTEDDYHAALDHLEFPKHGRPKMVSDGSNGTTHHFTKKNGALCSVVGIDEFEEKPFAEVCGLLIHEAVHIYQEMMSNLNERKAGIEIEAYSIQWIAQQLINSFMEQTGREVHVKVRDPEAA